MRTINRKRAGILLLSKYAEVIGEMSTEDAGILLKAVYAYDTGSKIPEMSSLAHAMFTLISADMRKHAERYESTCERNRSNAKKRWDRCTVQCVDNGCDRMPADASACDPMRPHDLAYQKCQEEEEKEVEVEEKGKYVSIPRANAGASPDTAHTDQSNKVHPLLIGDERERFEQFWQAYPRRESRARAEAAWREIGPDNELTTQILAAVENACASDTRFQTQQYTPHPHNWLLRREWENEYDKPKTEEVDYGSWGDWDVD